MTAPKERPQGRPRKDVTYKKRDGTKAKRKGPGKRQRKNFTEKNVLELETKRKQYRVWDWKQGSAAGLHILVGKTTKTYYSLYHFPGSPQRYSRRLGTVGVLKLEDARTMCRADQQAALQGIDPKREEPGRSDTVEAVINDYIDREQIARQRLLRAEDVRRVLLKHCAPFKDRPIATIRKDEIDALLERVRDGDPKKDVRGTPYMANRLYAHLGAMFKWCLEKNKLSISPMHGMKEPFTGAKARDRVFTDDELRKLWRCKLEPRQLDFLKLIILTGKRIGALADMKWKDIDATGFWTPPLGTRNKRNHPVPLSDLAQRVIGKRKPDGYVFPDVCKTSAAQGRFRKAVKDVTGIEDFYPHAVRHTVETRLAQLRVPPHLRDLLLDHVSKRGSGQDYDHHDYAVEMREAVNLWADTIEGIVMPKGVKALR